MIKNERITALSEQIELARRRLEELPQWQRSNAHFSGSNHCDQGSSSEPDKAPVKKDHPDLPAD